MYLFCNKPFKAFLEGQISTSFFPVQYLFSTSVSASNHFRTSVDSFLRNKDINGI